MLISKKFFEKYKKNNDKISQNDNKFIFFKGLSLEQIILFNE